MAMNDSPDELGWFGSSAVRKVKKTVKKVAKPLGKVTAPIQAAVDKIVPKEYQKYVGVLNASRAAVAAGLKKAGAPAFVGTIIDPQGILPGNPAYKKLVEQQGAINSARKKAANVLASAAKVNPGAKVALEVAKAGVALQLKASGKAVPAGLASSVQRVSAAMRAKPSLQAALRKGAPPAMVAPKSGVYIVVTPEGKRVEIPASKVR